MGYEGVGDSNPDPQLRRIRGRRNMKERHDTHGCVKKQVRNCLNDR